MKKLISIFSVGLILAASAGCSSANTSAANANTSSGQSVQQTGSNGQQKQPQRRGQVNNQALLSLLKIDSNTLRDDFKAGKSLADIAQEKGVKEQQVIDLLVKQGQQRIDGAVKSGKLTQDQADQRKKNEQDQIKKEVEHKGGFGGSGQGNPRHWQNNGNNQSNDSNNG